MRLAVLLPLLSLTGLPAQTVLHVPGTYPQIHQALAVAQPGDVVEVASGIYAPFAVTSGVTIRGTGSVAPSVSLGGPVTFQVPPGQQAYVFAVNLYTGAQVLSGNTAFERCTFEAPLIALDVDTAGEAALVQSNVVGGIGQRDGARVRGRLAALDSSFTGAASWVNLGGNAIRVEGGSVQLTRCQVRGGGAVLPAHPATDALVLLAGDAWLCDCTVSGGGSQISAGGNGITNQSGSPVLGARNTVTGGIGTPPGAAAVGPYVATAPLLGMLPIPNGIARGTASALGPQGPPGMPVFAYTAPRSAVVLHPALAEPAWLGGGCILLATGVLDATGNALFPFAIPNQPWLRDIRGFFQVYGIDAQGRVQATPPRPCLVQ